MPLRCHKFQSDGCASVSCLPHRRLPHRGLTFQCNAVVDSKLRSYAERQREVIAGNMAGLQAEGDRHPQVDENPHQDLLKRVVFSPPLITPAHLAKDNSLHSFQLACKLQLHQHTVDAVRWLVEILEEENRVSRADFIRSAQRCAEQRKTASIQHAVGCSFCKRFNFGRLECALILLSGCYRREPGLLVNAIRTAKISGRHGTMEGDQSRSIAQVCEQRGHIATTYEYLRIPAYQSQ